MPAVEAELLRRACELLGLPPRAVCTALALYHRACGLDDLSALEVAGLRGEVRAQGVQLLQRGWGACGGQGGTQELGVAAQHQPARLAAPPPRAPQRLAATCIFVAAKVRGRAAR